MIERRACLANCLLAFLPMPALAREAADSLNDELQPIRVKYGLPALAAAVTKEGAIEVSGAVGVRVYGTAIAVGIDDRLHLGSNTQAFTATFAGMAIDAGPLDGASTIGDGLGAEVPGLNPGLAAITLVSPRPSRPARAIAPGSPTSRRQRTLMDACGNRLA